MIYEEGGFYHVYNRGCNKELIFNSNKDYENLLRRINKSKPWKNFNIIAFCLMPNHYHFLIQQKSEIPISNWINYVFNGYVQSFNKQYNRSGTLFEGRAKPLFIDNENYLIRLVLYIHNNPVAAGLVNEPREWRYSNYLEWVGKRNNNLFDKEFFFEYFHSYNDYEILMKDYSKQKQSLENIKPYIHEL